MCQGCNFLGAWLSRCGLCRAEKGMEPLVQGSSTDFIDLTDSVVLDAWPMSSISYLLLRQQGIRLTCAAKTAALNYFQWIYTDPLAATIVTSLNVRL